VYARCEPSGNTRSTGTRTVAWPGGADLAPDTLYVRVQTGAWPASELAA